MLRTMRSATTLTTTVAAEAAAVAPSTWWRVADEFTVALAEMGEQWERGRLTCSFAAFREHLVGGGRQP
jgi:hypothetical protein